MNERILLKLIERACQRHGVELNILSDGWLLELRKADQLHRIVGSNFDFNDQAAASIARDKVATSSLLAANEIKHVHHKLLRQHDVTTLDVQELHSILDAGGAVVKPLKGGSGNFVARADTIEAIEKLTKEPGIPAWAISPFVDIVREVRLVIFKDKVGLAYTKVKPVVSDNLKLFNLSKGAKAEPLPISDISDELSSLAIAAMRVVGLHLAAVDIVITSADQVFVLEVNAAFSLARYAKINEATYEQVASFYDQIVADMFSQ